MSPGPALRLSSGSTRRPGRSSGATSYTGLRVSHCRKQPVSNTDNPQHRSGLAGAGKPSNFDNPAYESNSIDDRSTSFLSPPPPRASVTDSVLRQEGQSVISKERVC